MPYDIHGQPLRPGHCEVHPYVHEEYPCSMCFAENQREPRYQQQPEPQQQYPEPSMSHTTLLVGYDTEGRLVWMKTYNFADPAQEAQGRFDIDYVANTFPAYLVSDITLVKLQEDDDKDLTKRAHKWKKKYEEVAANLSKLEQLEKVADTMQELGRELDGAVAIKLKDGAYVPNCRKISRREDFDTNKVTFYEVGEYTDKDYTNWKRSGEFSEVYRLREWMAKDDRFNDPKWIEHHNFHQTI